MSRSSSEPRTPAPCSPCPWCDPSPALDDLPDLEQLAVEADALQLAQAPDYDQVDQ